MSVRRCPYRVRLVQAANLVVHPDPEAPPPDDARDILAHGLIYLDLEMAAVQIDLEKAREEIKALKRRQART